MAGSFLILGEGRSGTTAVFTAIRDAAPAPHLTLFEPSDIDVVRSALARPETVVVKLLMGRLPEGQLDVVGAFGRTVFLVRDPRDVLVSRMLYRARGTTLVRDRAAGTQWIEALRGKEEDPASTSVVSLVRRLEELAGLNGVLDRMRRMSAKTVRVWRRIERDAHLLHYEDFVEGRLAAVSDYLGLDVSTSVDVDHRFHRVARTRGSGDWRSWFLDEDVAFARRAFGPFMDAFGYNDWTRPARPSIDPEVGSEYVVRILEMRRKEMRRKETG